MESGTELPYKCCNCGAPCATNYCNWECSIENSKKEGGVAYCPNGLPILWIRYDHMMFEHEHGDHPDYKFPVDVEYRGPITDDHVQDYLIQGGTLPAGEPEVRQFNSEWHALIYCDESIALTMYECSYFTWELGEGFNMSCGGFTPRENHDKQLSEASLLKIRAFRSPLPSAHP